MSDFGLAQLADATGNPVKFVNENTPSRRCAPETVKHRVCSYASDVYMFGSCLWEFFTRTSPFNWIEGNIVEARSEERNEQLDPEYNIPESAVCPREIMELMKKCTAEKPEDRPKMSEVVQQLTDILNNYKGGNFVKPIPKPIAVSPAEQYPELRQFLIETKCEKYYQTFVDADIIELETIKMLSKDFSVVFFIAERKTHSQIVFFRVRKLIWQKST